MLALALACTAPTTPPPACGTGAPAPSSHSTPPAHTAVPLPLPHSATPTADTGAYVLPPPPGAMSHFEVGTTTPESVMAAGGHVLLAWSGEAGSWVVILDGEARIVWWAEPDPGLSFLRPRLSVDGGAVVVGEGDPTRQDDSLGRVARLSLHGPARSWVPAPGIHHDLVDLGDRAVYTAHRRTRGVVEGYTGEVAYVDEELRSVDYATGDVEVLWSFDRDYPVEPWRVCAHTDATSFVPGHHEWLHANSIADAPDGGWWLMARYADMLVRVGADGSYLGQLGGRDSTWTVQGQAFAHAHFSSLVGDELLVFDNGTSHPDAETRIRRYRLDEGTRVATETWSAPDPINGGHTPWSGDAIPLPGGHVLAETGPEGWVVELDEAGGLVWSARLGGTVGRLDFVEVWP